MSGSSLALPVQSPTSSDRVMSPGGLSFDSTSHTAAEGPISLHGSESTFFKALLEFLYTASSDNTEVFTFLFEDSAFSLSTDHSLDKLAQVFFLLGKP